MQAQRNAVLVLARPARHVGRRRAFECPVLLTRASDGSQVMGVLRVEQPRAKHVGKGVTHDAVLRVRGQRHHLTVSEATRLQLLAGVPAVVGCMGSRFTAQAFGEAE